MNEVKDCLSTIDDLKRNITLGYYDLAEENIETIRKSIKGRIGRSTLKRKLYEDAKENFNEWNDTTGAIPEHSGWYWEILSVIEDCVDIGFVAETKISDKSLLIGLLRRKLEQIQYKLSSPQIHPIEIQEKLIEMNHKMQDVLDYLNNE